MNGSDLREIIREVQEMTVDRPYGRVVRSTGVVIESEGPRSRLGEFCRVVVEERPGFASSSLEAEVVGFNGERVILMPFREATGLAPGALVEASGEELTLPIGEALLGRVVDALGRPVDGKGPIAATEWAQVSAEPPDPIRRPVIQDALPLGIRAIDSLLTCGRGQRVGIFAGAGVGKSTLMGMAVRSSQADVCVVALIGERGREVREFLERDLGADGLARSVVVVVPSSESPILRLKGAFTAITIAECFRDRGAHVLFVMDSLTRLAMARREIGLAIGEPPTSRGYPPSVFSLLPRFLERAGTAETGSITGLYTVLVEGDDMAEPVADAARGLLDGHVVLSRELASLNQYPAIDILRSVSRLMPRVASQEHREAASRVRSVLAEYAQIEDSLHLGTYQAGSDPKRDRLIARRRQVMTYLQQDALERAAFDQTMDGLAVLARRNERSKGARE